MPKFVKGDRVKWSYYALESARDWWQKQGEYSAKNRAKLAYDFKATLRGTVTASDEKGITVTWDDGTVSSSLSYRIELDK